MKYLDFNISSVKTLSSFLSGKMQKVTVKDNILDWIQSHYGVPQSRVLGLLLFNRYVNDLKPKTFEINQYADNTVLLTSYCDLDVCEKSPEYSIEDTLD